MTTATTPQFEFRIDPEIEGGTYANFVVVWHTAHEFTLDFAATLPAENRDEGVVVPARVVTRVKLPVSVVFDLLQAINDNMSKYESAFGAIRRPGEDAPYFPDDMPPAG